MSLHNIEVQRLWIWIELGEHLSYCLLTDCGISCT